MSCLALELRIAIALSKSRRGLGSFEECAKRLGALDRTPLVTLLGFEPSALREPPPLECAPEGRHRISFDMVEVLGQAEDPGEGVQVVQTGVDRAPPALDLGFPPREQIAA